MKTLTPLHREDLQSHQSANKPIKPKTPKENDDQEPLPLAALVLADRLINRAR